MIDKAFLQHRLFKTNLKSFEIKAIQFALKEGFELADDAWTHDAILSLLNG